MNSDTRRILTHFDSRSDWYQYYADGQLRDRLTSPSVAITVAVIAVTVLYRAASQHGWLPCLPSLPNLLCDALVIGVPGRWLFAIERFINPPLFPTEMLRHRRPQPTTRAAKRDALQKILGVGHPGGILGSVSHVGLRGLSSLSKTGVRGRPRSADQPPGLGNRDNSCYQNSILQGLASLKPLPAYLSAVSDDRRPHFSMTQTVDTLRDLMAKLSDPFSNGRTFWTPGVLKNMSTWQQQDAQEYYSKLLDQIDTEIARAWAPRRESPGLQRDAAKYGEYSSGVRSSHDSGYHSLIEDHKAGREPCLARNPLEGLVAQRVACVNCGYCEGLTMIPFNCLTLTLGGFPEHDLYERMDQHTKVEAIQGVECPKCTLLMCRSAVKALVERTGDVPEICQRLQAVEEALDEEAFDDATLTQKCKITPKARVSSTKTKQVALARPPQSLVFHVNRSGFDETTGFMYKNSAAVRFPMVLDMGPWCLGSVTKPATLPETVTGGLDVEQWTLNPRASMVAGERQPSRIAGPIYELRAVVTHYGQHENGHYVCYRRHIGAPPPFAGKNGAVAEHSLTSMSEEDGAGDNTAFNLEMSGAVGEANGSASEQNTAQARWWRLSDEDVTMVDESTVLSQGGVFMLFYDCVDPNSVRITETSRAVETETAAAQGVINLGEEIDKVMMSTDEGDAMEIDDVLPLSPTTSVTLKFPDGCSAGGGLPDGLSERSTSPDIEELEQNGTAVGWNPEPGHDRETDSASPGTTGDSEEGSPSPPPYDFSGGESYAIAA